MGDGADGNGDRGDAARDAASPETPTVVEPVTPFTQQLGRAAMVGAAILFVVFALANFQYVDFSWVFGSTEVTKVGGERTTGGIPLILLLIAAFGLGVTVGTFGAWRRGRRRARPNRPPE